MTDPDRQELACLALKVACALPRDAVFRYLARRLAVCGLAGDARDALYWLRVARLARVAPAALVDRAIARAIAAAAAAVPPPAIPSSVPRAA